MANLEDVANAAGVSKTTVSRFLNGSLVLPKKTAGQINAAIETLNYQPNPHARRLSLGRTDTIGLIVPDIATPFFSTFVAAIEAEADARGKTLVLHATLNRRDRELSYIDLVRQGHADGLIFITNHVCDAGLATKINSAGPCVVVDEDVAGANVIKVESPGGDYARHVATRRNGFSASFALSTQERIRSVIGGPSSSCVRLVFGAGRIKGRMVQAARLDLGQS